MPNFKPRELIVSGVGVTSSIGQGQAAFFDALIAGRHRFDVMQRPGRQWPDPLGDEDRPDAPAPFLGAEIGTLQLPASVSSGVVRTASFSAQVALATIDEAWQDAGLETVDPKRIGLVVGGSNFQQRELTLSQDKYRDRPQFLRPTYAMTFMDTDLCGLCTEHFGIRGFAYTLGAASASGQAAVLQGLEAVESGRVDVCIVIGALMDLSYWECQAFRTLGAMGSDRYREQPELACRPFDSQHDGFIFGEACGAIVIENVGLRKDVKPYALALGWGMHMDANRNPDPSVDGEIKSIELALLHSGLGPEAIDYVKPHGTGSVIGDATELEALRHCALAHARINTTKSVIGHGLSAAGAVEIVAALLQMKNGILHPCRNLDAPIDNDFEWVQTATELSVEHALTMSMGFGGINTAICWQRS